MREIHLQSRIVFGENALDCLREIRNKKVLIVCDDFMVQSGVAARIAALPVDCEVAVFSGVVPDPPVDVVAAGVAALKAAAPDVLIAVGGGSSIDAAKGILAVARMAPGGVHPHLEFFAVPTTSGTGSEVTDFAVISDPAKGLKYPLADIAMRPDVAVLAPELVASAPPRITADTGMDVLTHAMESMVSTEANDFSDALAEKAVSITCKFLPLAYEDGNNMLAREEMHCASTLAGMSFNAAGLGLCHAIAHGVGGQLHIPHGRANAMLLPYVMAFNADLDRPVLDEDHYSLAAKKYSRIARIQELPAPSIYIGVNNLVREVHKLIKRLGVPANLREAGVDPEAARAARPAIVKAALADVTLTTNPRPATARDIEAILDQIGGR